MQLLPKWVLTNPLPSVYDTESGSVLEMTAKVYSAMGALIEEYNTFADNVNGILESEHKSREEFQTALYKVWREFQCQMESYLKINLEETAADILNSAMEAGKIVIKEEYDPETESLNLIAGGET